MVSREEFRFPSSDGVHQIYGVWWLPEDRPRAMVQLVHGISEHMGRYDPFARFLVERGFAVAGHDHLGHGGTARDPSEYGFFASRHGWDHLVRDVKSLHDQMGRRFPGLPCFLLGHSMGSFAARTYLIEYPGTVDGCLLLGTGQEAPALVAFGKALAAALCRLRGDRHHSPLVTALSLGAYNARFRPARTKADWISRDQAVVDAYVADPLCRFVPTVGMFRDMMDGLQRIADPKALARMDPHTPVGLFSGEADPVGSEGRGVEKVAGFFRQAGCRDLTVKLYPGARHELLNETNRQEVFSDLLSWLEARLPG